MLLQLLIELMRGIVFYVVGFFPTITVPAFADSGGAMQSAAASLGSAASGLGTWVPFSAVGACLTAILASAAISLVCFIVRYALNIVSVGQYGNPQ
jgi:hypothetical protein